MNQAYRLHLERIQKHDEQHQVSHLASSVLQTLYPDLSCKECYLGKDYHRDFRTFWNKYKNT